MATDVTCLQCGRLYDASLVENRFAGVCPACLVKFAAGDSETGGSPEPAFKPPLKIGATFHGLEVAELLGAGGMGVVYKARQPGLDRFVALKVLSPQLSGDPEFLARFNREAKAMAALSHPGIVQIFDFGRESDLCFLVMEFVDGLSLRQLMRDGSLTPEKALQVVPRICEALEYAHSKGVIHRDIKPENILLDRDGRVKIADFGLARMLTGDAGAPVTMSRVVMGTPGYMAPEQYQGMKVDHRADIYSLGAVFYEMLTGRIPMGRFEPPSARVRVDVRLDDIVLKALENEPERRYQRAGDVKTDVEMLGSALPKAPWRPPTHDARTGRKKSGWFKAAWWIAMFPIALVGGLVLAAVTMGVHASLGGVNSPAFWVAALLIAVATSASGIKINKATSPEPKVEGKPEVFWLASASIGFALFGAIMTGMATVFLLQVSR